MRTIARLVLAYLTATPLVRAFSCAGWLVVVASFFLLRSLWHTDGTIPLALGWTAALGEIALFLGSSMMPIVSGRLAGSRLSGVLPRLRVKLLASAFVTVLLVALPPAVLIVFGHPSVTGGKPLDPALAARIRAWNVELFWVTYLRTFLTAGWLYLTLWFLTSRRSIGGVFRALVVIALLLYAPTREIRELDAQVRYQLLECALIWGVFAVGFLWWPRWRTLATRLHARWPLRMPAALSSQVRGRELDLLLGTANPWLLAAGQVLPIVLAMRIGYYSAAVWLYYLTIFSTVAGAIAGHAAERSRAVWLRAGWSRAGLFGAVERSFWRHNGYVLGLLLILMLTIGSYAGLPASVLLIGMPLLVLGTVLSTYLGLMVTRGLRWLEGTLAIAVMLTLMAGAVLAARGHGDELLILALEIVLAGTALALRFTARERWQHLDWALCRPELAPRARGAG
jgi:hypothetical protein